MIVGHVGLVGLQCAMGLLFQHEASAIGMPTRWFSGLALLPKIFLKAGLSHSILQSSCCVAPGNHSGAMTLLLQPCVSAKGRVSTNPAEGRVTWNNFKGFRLICSVFGKCGKGEW